VAYAFIDELAIPFKVAFTQLIISYIYISTFPSSFKGFNFTYSLPTHVIMSVMVGLSPPDSFIVNFEIAWKILAICLFILVG